MLERLQALVRWAFGDLEHKPPEPGSAGLISWVCVVTCFAMIAGEWHAISGHPVLRSFYRLAVHGAVPLAGVVLWTAWTRGRSRLLATVAAVACLFPVALRMLTDGGVATLREQPALLVVPTLVGAAMAIVAAHRAGEGVGAWGLGLGDWRWWLPRTGLALLALGVGCVAATLAFDSLADFYPTGAWARQSWGNFALRHLGIGVDFLGWEFVQMSPRTISNRFPVLPRPKKPIKNHQNPGYP